MTQTIKKKIICVGPPQCALEHFKKLSQDFVVHMIERGPRQPVKDEILRLCQTEGPFSAAFMFFVNSSYGPHNEDIWAPLWQYGNSKSSPSHKTPVEPRQTWGLSVFVASSRGEVVNTEALIHALQTNKIKRAAIDVFENEPNIPEYLLHDPRVTCTPHVAAYTSGTIERGEKALMDNARAFLETGTPLTPVNGPF